MFNPTHDDEDEDRDQILQLLGGKVDDFAGSKLKDPDAPKGQGVTIEISVKPHGGPEEKEEKPEGEPNMEAENEEHDPIAHILGMCGGGCA
jgi:hypothetical protein